MWMEIDRLISEFKLIEASNCINGLDSLMGSDSLSLQACIVICMYECIIKPNKNTWQNRNVQRHVPGPYYWPCIILLNHVTLSGQTRIPSFYFLHSAWF